MLAMGPSLNSMENAPEKGCENLSNVHIASQHLRSILFSCQVMVGLEDVFYSSHTAIHCMFHSGFDLNCITVSLLRKIQFNFAIFPLQQVQYVAVSVIHSSHNLL